MFGGPSVLGAKVSGGSVPGVVLLGYELIGRVVEIESTEVAR